MTMPKKKAMNSKSGKPMKRKWNGVKKNTDNTIKKNKETLKANVASTSVASLSHAAILHSPSSATGTIASTLAATTGSKVVLDGKKGNENGEQILDLEKKDKERKEQVKEGRRKDKRTEKQIFKGKSKVKESRERIAGFIFMCNAKTKSECYRHRVFGLPIGKKDVVEKIKFGAKLFLFDFDLKLLYGIYEATSNGRLNLERNAFKGSFPAQVRFKVHEDCLPLPENSFRHAIKDNYEERSRFRQELTSKQVRSLTSLFRPVTVQSDASRTPRRPLRSPAPVMQEEYRRPARPAPEESYISGRRHTHQLPAIDSQSGHIFPRSQYDQYELDTRMGHMQPLGEPRLVIQESSLPRYADQHYFTGARREYTPEEVLFSAHDPYRRYAAAGDTLSREPLLGYESEYRTLQPRGREVRPETEDGHYSSHLPLGYALPPAFARRELALSSQAYYPSQSHAYADPLLRSDARDARSPLYSRR